MQNLKFSNKRKSDGTTRGYTRDTFIDSVVKERIWNKDMIFERGCDSECWVDSNHVFPIIAQKYGVNMVWYTLGNATTTKINATIS